MRQCQFWNSLSVLIVISEKIGKPNVHLVQLDVTDEKSISEVVKKIENEQERLDILVNNAGNILKGVFIEFSSTLTVLLRCY